MRAGALVLEQEFEHVRGSGRHVAHLRLQCETNRNFGRNDQEPGTGAALPTPTTQILSVGKQWALRLEAEFDPVCVKGEEEAGA